MQRRLPITALIGQERRAITLSLILMLSVIFTIDWVLLRYFWNGSGLILLLPYGFLFLLIPLAVVFIKKKNPRLIKYIFFWTYLITCFITEIFVFWDSSSYEGGNIVELYFILFSPIFINKRYYNTVTVGICMKYILMGLLLQDTKVVLPIVLTLVFAIVAYIILNRFLAYVDALNDSYNKQFETTLSSGMAIMNHTIKNEITKIQYLNNRMKELVSNLNIQDVNPIMDSIQQASIHMLMMSNRLQDKTGEIVLQEETHNLNSILNSAISMIEPIMQKNHVRCVMELTCDVDMMCDQLQLQEALMNIVMNAAESMEQSGGIMTVRLLRVSKDIVIKIEDNGCGIPSDIRTRVFEPFFTTRSTLNNYGLGLSYSNNVIEKHSGSLEIHSEVNVGTMVLIRFPHQRIVLRQKSDQHEVGGSRTHDKGIAG